ncbi:hypothetical protein GEMRC1_008934 [Eukaryota sp. GEM-RC1]
MFLIVKVPVTLIVNSLEVPFVNYLSSSFRFLGCYLGSHDNIVKDLNVYLDSMRKELDQIKELQLEKHLKFFMLKICYSGKVTHLLRSLPPVLTYNFCRSFNKIRTDFLAFLLSVDPAALNNHIFSDPHLGGIGFTSSKWWTKSAFIGGGNKFVFEFCRRYPSQENLLVSTSSFFLVNLRSELSLISPDLWQTCFPADICEIPERCVTSLKFALKKLQKHLLKHFECLDFKIRLGSAKEKNPAFANFLIDLKDSSSVALINQIPQIYGLLLNDYQWTTTFRLRCFLWPSNLPNDFQCKCGKLVTFSHLLSCNRFITYRTCIHDAVRDQIHAMCKSYKIESFVEPLLRSLKINNSKNSDSDKTFGKRRADVIVPSVNDELTVVDVITVDVCRKSAFKDAKHEVSPLNSSEQYKRNKYDEPLTALKHIRHVEYKLCPFAISIYGRLGRDAFVFSPILRKW